VVSVDDATASAKLPLLLLGLVTGTLASHEVSSTSEGGCATSVKIDPSSECSGMGFFFNPAPLIAAKTAYLLGANV